MNFRRWITALAVVTLFVGMAAAQTSGGGTALTCNTVAQVTPTIRSEGLTEEVGDIVITCQGGSYLTTGSPIPQGNIVISLTAPVTSRLASGTAPTGAAGQPSEALLLIDEPNSGLAPVVSGFGPAAPISVCPTPGSGCVEYAQQVGTIPVASSSATSALATYNVFQGNVANNTISFQGIPFLPPVTEGVSRVYRITNVRVNATSAGSSVVSGVQPVYAYISTNGASTLPINSQNGITVAFVSTSLNPYVTPTNTSFVQCQPQTTALVATLNYADLFPSAFKTRIAPFSTAANSSYIGTSSSIGYPQQSVPGALYGSESNFILPVNIGVSGAGVQAGLADFGTRFQAVFANLPTNATIYVSTQNLVAPPSGTVIGGQNTPEPPVALLTTGGASGVFTASTTGTYYPLTLTNNGATVVWEVVNNNTSANVDFTFGVYLTYAANNPPVIAPGGSPTVTMSYAPISGVGTASATANVPRFILGTASTPQPINVVVGPCQTILLFPFVVNSVGFDTGVAISNTSADPFSTPTSSGTCQLSWYGLNAPAQTTIGPVPAGNGTNPAAYSFVVSGVAPGFEGYMFAVCNFQFAHGFAFISDPGARNLAMGYLALIVTNGNNQITYRSKTGQAGTNWGAETLNN